ncbi:MAG: polysaccharide biosynthesis protein [Ruminococcaceae bacterium]|nr:polysaccharide biosynthesis protein [Oscillospiraceae bacterium]
MQKDNQPKSFMYGAIILLIANALVKVIGAVFKIPLTYILGEEGMGYFSTSYQMYTWMFIIATAGLPVAISKMVSESSARDRHYEVRRILAVSIKLLMVIGVAGCLLLYFGADFFAEKLLKNSGAAYGIKAIAPAMLFVSAMSAFRGYFQGLQNMIPTALSEVAEALGKLIIGFGAAYMLASYGMELASAGAVFGVSCGGALGFVILYVLYRKHKASSQLSPTKGACESDRYLLKKLIKIAVPITIGASVFSLTSLIDMAMIMRRLQAGGFSMSDANKLWGSYSGYAFPLFNLPPTLINAITVSIVPAIASAFAKKEYATAASTTCKSMKITILFSLPCAVGMSMLASPILNLVYGQTNAAQTLEILAIAIVFVSLVLVTNAILQATGNAMVPVKNMLIGGVFKVIINYFLVAHPTINIKGAPIGTTVCYITILGLNLYDMKKRMKITFPLIQLVLKPVIAVAAMAISLYFVSPIFAGYGKLIASAAPIAVGAVVYAVVLVAIRGIDEEDIALLPKAEALTRICKKLKIIR